MPRDGEPRGAATRAAAAEDGRGHHHIGKKEKASKTHVAIAGAVSGLVSRFVIAPLDVVKIRMQLQHHSPTIPPLLGGPRLPKTPTTNSPIYTSILPSLLLIRRQEGLRGLWKGNIPAELLYLLYGSTQFLCFRTFTRLITSSRLPIPDPLKNSLAGAAAGAAATTLTYPLDLLRTRFASTGTTKVYAGIWRSIAEIYATEGPTGFFRGLGAGVVQIVPYMGIFFGTYEATRSVLTHNHTLHHHHHPSSSSNKLLPPTWPDAVSGMIAAVVAKTAVFPLDLIRKRLQVQGPTRALYVHKDIPVYTGILQAGKAIVMGPEGWRGLYKGLAVSLVKAAPASAATMWTFEQTMRVLKWKDGVEEE
ncbi:mitochondrial thiamine pyrophosphate carrier [Peziza echinospora]|nr:mitochondrial thiamine pyrophosphate carrier [Peziza echinospora]